MAETMPAASRARIIGFVAGIAALALTLVLPPPAGLGEAAWHTAGVAFIMAIWWATEATHVAVTSLLPITLFPVLGITDIEGATAPYGSAIIFLFLGGFVVALSMERWGLHRRVALWVIAQVGAGPHRLVFGFMLATALLSMWITNSATTMMMLPIATSVIGVLLADSAEDGDDRDKTNFAVCLMLGIAYAASIGGVGTLIGTATNVAMANILKGAPFYIEVGFAEWMMVGMPFVAIMLPLSWFALTRFAYPFRFAHADKAGAHVAEARRRMGPITAPEMRVAAIAALVGLAWVLRGFFKDAVPGASDAGIAIAGALALFLLPAGGGQAGTLMDWKGAGRLPWGIVLLLGGGLALADAMGTSGLAAWISVHLAVVGTWPLLALMVVIVTIIIGVTELTSNAAIVSAFVPVVGALALGIGLDPMMLAAPVAIAASCAFMLPVATPPNAIVFGSGYVTVPQMMRAGLLLNLVAIPLVTALGLLLVPLVFS
ncbi:DASS family sodium-coupled anion symporter [Iodidimonas sp. SYSU 1G8]|uniref:DASS family sodium-coupled anion symporter n=1 Tax=Iodidimonas sp. SYSU 1G8 TaxID=3133967 RepID=UPI0031FF1F27